MAQVVFGIGSSHSPILNMTPEAWLVRGQLDQANVPLYDFAGNKTTYEELLANAASSIPDQLDVEVLQQRHSANQRAISRLRDALYAAEPDVLLIFGDDHYEVFKDDNMPLLSIYWGETFPYIPEGILKWPYAPELKTDLWYSEQRRDYPVCADLARHLIETLVDNRFDVAHSKRYREGQGMGHAFAFVYCRLMDERIIPTVPIHINTYFPPNQITPERCYELGTAVRRAVESWHEDARVAVLGSGGLSHFVVDEALDQKFIQALRSRDPAEITALPRKNLNGGNSEFRNWIALAATVEHLDTMELVDYVPCYRSNAGTGCAMGFAKWQ